MMRLGLRPADVLRIGVELLLLAFLLAPCAQAIDISWQRCLGGNGTDWAYSAQQTSDGGYVVAGYTNSNDGNVSGNHGINFSTSDFWVVKLNSTGHILWQRCLGGTQNDRAYSIQQTSDGGYVVAGYTLSTDGDVIGKHGWVDCWVVKLNATGNITWQRCLGGTYHEKASSVRQTSDGGFMVAGYTKSNDGNVSGNHGGADFWVVKLNATGYITWQKCLGGGEDDEAYSVQQTSDGGYVVAGYTYSNDCDVIGNHGGQDFWVAKLNDTGYITWQKCLGGSGNDWAYGIHQTLEGGYVVAGLTLSDNDGDVSGNHGVSDYWVVKLDPAGNKVWQRCLGGRESDWATSVQQTSDGGYVVAGYTDSTDGNVSGNHGGSDYWIVKLLSCIWSSTSPVCNGTPVQFNGVAGMDSYRWEFVDGVVSLDPAPAHLYSAPGSYAVNLTVTKDNCTSICNGTVEVRNLTCFQPPEYIEWQRCLGGSMAEWAYIIRQTSDGGYVVAGPTFSNDGDVSGNHGDTDFWVVRLNSAGHILWQRCLGGNGRDWANSIQQTADGHYVVAGFTNSNDHNVTGNHGMSDFWVVRLSSSGHLDWQKCLGGGGDDEANSIQQIAGGGYIVAGYTGSNDGDVSGNHGDYDYWVVELSSSGSPVWKKCLGGTGEDKAYSIRQTADGGYIVAGYTKSNDGDVSGLHGGSDYWVVKLDASRNLVWQKCLGGGGDDEAYSVLQAADGGYVVAGETESDDGNVSGNHGDTDFWVVKLDPDGNLVWQRCLGGGGHDGATNVYQAADGGILVAGYTESNDGDVSGIHGLADYWVVKLSPSGHLVWQRCLGGSNTDHAHSIQQTSDGGYVVTGSTNSYDGDVTGKHGELDFWVVKMCGINSTIIASDIALAGTANNPATAAESGASYSWTITNGLITSASNTQSINFTAGSSGITGLGVKAFRNCTCSQSYKNITIISWPNCNWTFNAPACCGTPVNFTGPKYMGSYNWSFGDGAVSSGEDPAHLYSAPGNYTVNLTVTTLGSTKTCTGSVVVWRADCSWSSNAPVCNGLPVNFTGPKDMDSYRWEFDDGAFNTSQNTSHIYSAPRNYIVNLTVAKGGCIKTCLNSVIVKPFPKCSWTSSAPVCNGTLVNFTGPKDMDLYNWSFGDGAVSSAPAPAHLYSAPRSYAVNLTVTKDNCSSLCNGTAEVRPPTYCGSPAYIERQRCLGGSLDDGADCVYQAADGGIVVAGYADSNDGDVSGNHGNGTSDLWVTKLNLSGSILWQRCLGGSSWEEGFSIQQTSDGGYVVAGYTSSNDGDVSGYHGKGDSWVVKLDPSGNKTWQRCLGGSGEDRANSVQETTDGGYVVAGYTYSNNGDVSGNHGNDDFWVTKLDSSGNKVWQKCLGGSNFDSASSIQQTADKGYVVAGNTFSNNGDVSGNHRNGTSDYWVVKLSSAGNKVWQRCLGGTDWDGASSIQQTSDGGYVVAGSTWSNDGNVSGNHGSSDFWVVKLDPSGNLFWQRCLGGSGDDRAHSVRQTRDGGYVVAGYTSSNDGDVSGNHDIKDYWVTKLDPSGNLVWQRCLGGSGDDRANGIQQTPDGGYIVVGYTDSAGDDSDVSGNHGGYDFWVVKLGEINSTITAPGMVYAGSADNPATTAESGADYSWGITNGAITSASNAQSINFTARAAGVTRLNVTVFKKCSCSESYKDIIAQFWPECSWSSNAPVCDGTPVQFTGPAGMESYRWEFGDGQTNSSKDPAHLYAAPGTYAVNLTVRNASCSLSCNGSVEVRPLKCSEPPPVIGWQKCLGGGSDEEHYSVQRTSDGGYVVAGGTYSNDGDVSGLHGGSDFWVVKLNATGNRTWQRCLGGSHSDKAYSIQQTSDGGYVVAGYTESNDGDVSGNHDISFGTSDFWVVKLNSTGHILWQRCLGGTKNDRANSIQQTSDGGYVVAGYTLSNDGNVSGNHGWIDYWVVKLNSTGNITWQRCLGGSSDDRAYSVQQTSDGGYVVAGSAQSTDGDVSGNHGYEDYWVVRIDPSGNKTWQRCLGGTYHEKAASVRQTTDGGYVVAGYTESNNGDVSGLHGGSDFWVVKLDPSGNLVWQRCLGGGSDEGAASIQQTSDGGYVVAGITLSNDGDVSGNHGQEDFWAVKLNATSGLVWQRCLGGSGDEGAAGIQQTSDGWYVVAGGTRSNNGEVSGNHGESDYWVVKLRSTIVAPDEVAAGSTDNVATAEESGVGYLWTITNGTITSANDTQKINFTAGASGIIRLDVRTFKNCSCNESYKYITIVSPDCSWTSNSPVCNGTPVNFTGPAGMDAYQWSFGDGAASSNQSPSHLYSAPGNYAVNLTTTKSGFNKTCEGTVVVLSEANCSWTSNGPVCNGTAVQFTGPAGMDSYNWSFGDGAASSEQSPSHPYSAPGTYTVNLTTKRCGTNMTCEGAVTILSGANCSWSSNSPVCNGTPVQFTGPGGMDIYSWDFGDNTTSSEEDPVHLYSAPGTYNVSLNATNDSCSATCSSQVRVKPMPDCRWSSNSPVCNGTPVKFTGPARMDIYSWDFGDNTTSSAKDPVHLYSAPDTYDVSLNAAKDSCSATCSGQARVKPMPDCRWSSTSPVCNGTPVQFRGPDNMDSYSWSFGDSSPINSSQNPAHLYSAPGIYNVSLNAINNSCSKTCNGSVEVLSGANCTWTSNSPVCNGSPVKFTGPAGMKSYNWSFGDGQYNTSRSPSHLYVRPGTYAVNLTVTKSGCSKSCLGWVEVILADCNWTACTPMCNGTEIQFHAPSGMDAYHWDFGDGSNSTEEDPSHLYPAPGTYEVTLAVTRGKCSDTCKGSVEVIVCPPNPPEYNSTVSYEDLLKSQHELITSLGGLLQNTTLSTDHDRLYSFLESFDDLAHGQKKGIYSYEDLVSYRWQELTPQQKINLTDSFETLLRQSEIILSCEENLLKRDWCKLNQSERQHLLDKFEADLHHLQMLLSKFEDWLDHQQTTEDCYKKWWLKLLASFEDLIRRESDLLESFEMLLKVDCKGEYIEVTKSAQPLEVNEGAPVEYNYTIAAKSTHYIKNVSVKDSLWGEVGTVALLEPGVPQNLTVVRPLNCTDCNSCRCKVCNFAMVCGEVITANANFTVCDIGDDLCVRVDRRSGAPVYPG